MKINDVARIVGLNKKTIRFYESEGLFFVNRADNAYREYSEENIEAIKTIKILRNAGVSLTDIKLLQHKIVKLDEILCKRINELTDEKSINNKQHEICVELISKYSSNYDDFLKKYLLQDVDFDNCECKKNITQNVTIGIDIGTSFIKIVVIDFEYKTVYEYFNIPNDSYVISEHNWEKCQNPQRITQKIKATLVMLEAIYPNIKAIGITGQMHGILYVDIMGNAVSNLYTWQDGRAGLFYNDNTYCDTIYHLTSEKIWNGFGIATHYYLHQNKQIPKNSIKFCTIMDYIGMQITNTKSPIMHVSNADSLGLFDLQNNCFYIEKLKLLNIDLSFLPETTTANKTLGFYKNIPVSIAIGDQQASFIGAVNQYSDSILVNIGTGSQVSVMSRKYVPSFNGIETRPFMNGSYLRCYCALCGGSAYAAFEKFFRKIAMLTGSEDKPQYDILEKMLSNIESYDDSLKIKTTFCGTRENPEARGLIDNISINNFTPEYFTLGILNGIVSELYEKALVLLKEEKINHLVASGNGVRKNPILQKILAEKFNMTLILPEFLEEAAIGAAKFSIENLSIEGKD